MRTAVLFKEVSHIKVVRRGEKNNDIERIHKGEAYEVMFNSECPEEDIKTESWVDRWRLRWNLFTKCVAKEDRWRSGGDVMRTVEDVVKDWNERIYYNSEDGFFYFRHCIEVTMLSGETFRTYFDTENEMYEHLESVYKASKMKSFSTD